MKKIISLLLTSALILALAVPTLALSETREASVTYRGIRLVVNGEAITPVDGDGNAVEPFIMEGSTYLPLRAVAGALSLDVEWDDTASTVKLTTGGTKKVGAVAPKESSAAVMEELTYRDIKLTLDGKTLVPKDSDGNVVEPFIMGGNTYLPLRAIAGALDISVRWDDATSTVTLGGKGSDTPEGEGAWLMTSARRVSASGSVTERQSYEYSDAGLPLSCTSSGGGLGEGKITFTTNSSGLITRASWTNGSYRYYEYDTSGRLTGANAYTGSSSYSSYVKNTWAYDKTGHVIETGETTGYVSVSAYTRERVTHSVDERGLCVKEQRYADTGSTSTTPYAYFANDVRTGAQGRVESVRTYQADSGGKDLNTAKNVYTLSYDDAARTLRWSFVSAYQGKTTGQETVTVTYDEYGNITRVEDSSGYYEYTYAFFKGAKDVFINTALEPGIDTDTSRPLCTLGMMLDNSPYKEGGQR